MLCRRPRSKTRLFHEQFESRLLLSAIAFVSHEIVSTIQVRGANSVYAADLDGDVLELNRWN